MASVNHTLDGKKTEVVRVLIAEDEALIALSLCDLLEDEGYEVILVADGAQALIEARRLGSTLSALLTDLDMPHMTGAVLIQTLHIEQPELPVVVLTGSAPSGGLEELRRQSGGHEPLNLLHKPIEFGMLLNALQDAITSARHAPAEIGSGNKQQTAAQLVDLGN